MLIAHEAVVRFYTFVEFENNLRGGGGLVKVTCVLEILID